MKATIDKDGLLVVTPESELEQFALSVWEDAQINGMTHPERLLVIVKECEDGE